MDIAPAMQQLHDRLQGWNPLEVLAHLSDATPVVLLHSGRGHARWAKQSWLGFPDGVVRIRAATDTGLLHELLLETTCANTPVVQKKMPVQSLFKTLRAFTTQAVPQAFWAGFFCYELHRVIEPMPLAAADDRDWPLIELQRCSRWLCYDHATQAWQIHGTWDDPKLPPVQWLTSPSPRSLTAQPPQSTMTRQAYVDAVQCALDYIRAGDVFQVNLTQRFTTQTQGHPRALFHQLAQVSPAWYGAYIEPFEPARDAAMPSYALASTSPELFLELDAQKRVTTRPIKGTLAGESDPAKLLHSEKDAAELNMIVDLMRNDLGRVCTYGSLNVSCAREIEQHPTVYHGVSTIQGTLHRQFDVWDLLRACFPGGSITGAPKIRAMQIIDELEPVQRGPYCGCLGYMLGETACFNIAIRTMQYRHKQQEQGQVDYNVGAGIVADSEPELEYEETITKAKAILQSLGQTC